MGFGLKVSNIILLMSVLNSQHSAFGQFYLQEEQIPEYYSEDDSKIETLKETYKSLCHSIQKEIELKDEDYEYNPSSYTEYICTRPERKDNIITKDSHMCTFPGFKCVQRYNQLAIARRRKSSEIWEFYSQTIASNCECMLPQYELPSENIPYIIH